MRFKFVATVFSGKIHFTAPGAIPAVTGQHRLSAGDSHQNRDRELAPGVFCRMPDGLYDPGQPKSAF